MLFDNLRIEVALTPGLNRLSPLDSGLTGVGRGIADIAVIARDRRKSERQTLPRINAERADRENQSRVFTAENAENAEIRLLPLAGREMSFA